MTREEYTQEWRVRMNDAIGAAEGLQDYTSQFIKEASQILHDWGNPYPMAHAMLHFSDYRATVNEIIDHLYDSMKIYREYLEIFGDENFIRCDKCDKFKRGGEYYSVLGDQLIFLCPDCAASEKERGVLI